jgi:hypothetical protein
MGWKVTPTAPARTLQIAALANLRRLAQEDASARRFG